jgi:hypothetical protein
VYNRVFTQVTFGIPRNTEFYTEVISIPRNSASFRGIPTCSIPRNSVSFVVHGISYFKETDSLGRNVGGNTERKRKRERDRGDRDRRKEGKRQRERDRLKETG